MAKVPLQSEKFKKDYMMALAFLLFFAIVGSECFLAVWLPWHLKLDSVWAKQVARHELVERFDYVRRISRTGAEKLPKPAGAESALICRSLDRAAAFMHQHNTRLSPRQCRIFMDVLGKQQVQYFQIAGGKTFSDSIDLDDKKFLQTLRGVKKVR